MPERGKRSEWEREDNRTKLFYTLLNKPRTFTELLEETEFARSTLTKHLKYLSQRQIIERAIEDDRIVYRIIYDEERLLSEIRSMHYDLIIEIISQVEPLLAILLESYFNSLVKVMIHFNKMKIEGKREISTKEVLWRTADLIESESPPEFIDLIQPRLDLFKAPSKELVEQFEQLRKKLEHVEDSS